jgi:hypothetical protein
MRICSGIRQAHGSIRGVILAGCKCGALDPFGKVAHYPRELAGKIGGVDMGRPGMQDGLGVSAEVNVWRWMGRGDAR